jgi:hypothetical protein
MPDSRRADNQPLPKRISADLQRKAARQYAHASALRAAVVRLILLIRPSTPERFIALDKANEGLLKDKVGRRHYAPTVSTTTRSVSTSRRCPRRIFDVQVTIFGHIRQCPEPQEFYDLF